MKKIDMDMKKMQPLFQQIEQLQQANKALSLQNEVLSGAYETSQRRVNELEAEIEKLNSPPDFFTLKKAQ